MVYRRIGTALRLGVLGLFLASGCAVTATEACRDFLTAFGNVAERCGDDREVVEEIIENDIRATYGSGCGGADRIRDEDDFYDVCLPYIESLSCDDYASGTFSFPPECIDQLIYLM